MLPAEMLITRFRNIKFHPLLKMEHHWSQKLKHKTGTGLPLFLGAARSLPQLEQEFYAWDTHIARGGSGAGKVHGVPNSRLSHHTSRTPVGHGSDDEGALGPNDRAF
ncbi:hypothetical protein QJS10_CPA09g01054 [Acorus calamus]|uniref:Uncharacterized protein n=1 Tax=Acorus calamus TaxID=4465 RepID=A0AAV9E4X2_ACOCL|nr:hypothetical protein QJS10_CPA09g01054 [Acorus calamus]